MFNKIIKKILILIIVIIFITSCNSNENEVVIKNNSNSDETIVVPVIKEKSINSQNETLVCYFSQFDSISSDANIIKDYLFSDFSEIVPEISYTKEDLDFNNIESRAYKELENDEERPKILNAPNNISKYKYIFIGFPIWNGKVPNIIWTFLEKYDFNNKHLVPFCKTNSSYDLEDIKEQISNHIKGNATIYDVKNIKDGEFVDNITSWIDSFNFDIKYDKGLIAEESTIEIYDPDVSEATVDFNNR